MSSGGATLQGSYSGATGTIDEVGFYYGTTSGNLPNKAAATGTGSPFSKAITGLTAGTKYYYKAYVHEYNESTSSYEYRYGSVSNFTTTKLATASVTTSAASAITSSAGVLNGSYSGASGTIYETGFYWGTAQNNLPNKVTTDGSNAASGSFSCTIGGASPLDAGSTYYYRAYVLEYNEATGAYEERLAGSVLSFSTTAVPAGAAAYLTAYGMPDVSGLNPSQTQTGTYSDKDDTWYRFSAGSNSRQIAVHTYTHPTSSEKTVNYIVLYDQSKYAPLWTAHTMNTTYWPNNSVGRNDSWMNDPAISLTQQSGLDDANSVGYSRGHLVASNYRQATVKQNKQTFYYSNQAPQWQSSFNDGIWSDLETAVASKAPSGTTMMYVVTGVLYEGNTTTLPSGNLNVPIPSHFYKCIMKCTFSGSTITGAQGIAFVYTNEAHNGSYYDAAYVTSIDAIEARAGFDFFAYVPTQYQKGAEANTNASWFTN